jgi:hypothetical protein
METLLRVLNHGRIHVSTLIGHDLDEFLLAQILPELTVLGHIPLQIFPNDRMASNIPTTIFGGLLVVSLVSVCRLAGRYLTYST